ncbi:MAG: hypothetical protein WBS22_19610, partial [Methylocystis sp.]
VSVTSAATGPLTAIAQSYGGAGGSANGGFPGGAGGNAVSTINVSSASSDVFMQNIVTGGGGGLSDTGPNGANGTGSAYSKVTSTLPGAFVQVQSLGHGGVGGSGGAGAARSEIDGAASGSAIANASQTSGSSIFSANSTAAVAGTTTPTIASASAVDGATIHLLGVTEGQSASRIVSSPKFSALAAGALSIGYGGAGQSLTYDAGAAFSLSTPSAGDFGITFLNDQALGKGFDAAMLTITVNGSVVLSQSFTSLAAAETYFANDTVDLGVFAGGVTSFSLDYSLTGSAVNSGFGFDYALDYGGGAPLGAPGPVPSAGGVLSLVVILLRRKDVKASAIAKNV